MPLTGDAEDRGQLTNPILSRGTYNAIYFVKPHTLNFVFPKEQTYCLTKKATASRL